MAEIARQLGWLLRSAVVPEGSGGRGSTPEYLAARRAEADALSTRLQQLAADAARLIPRADSGTETGGREIPLGWRATVE